MVSITVNIVPSLPSIEGGATIDTYIITHFSFSLVFVFTQNVGFLNVGRVQSGLFQPTFSKKSLLIKTRSLLKPTILLKFKESCSKKVAESKKAHDFAEISFKKV